MKDDLETYFQREGVLPIDPERFKALDTRVHELLRQRNWLLFLLGLTTGLLATMPWYDEIREFVQGIKTAL